VLLKCKIKAKKIIPSVRSSLIITVRQFVLWALQKGCYFCITNKLSMKNATKILFLSLILLQMNNSLYAQIVKPTVTQIHTANVNLGFDYTIVGITAGYSYFVPKYKTAAFANITQGSALLGTGNYRAQIGLQNWQVLRKKFMLKSEASFTYARSANNAGKFSSLGLTLNINPAIMFRKYAVGLDVQYNPFFATNIQHSDLWKQNYYNSKDGLYSTTAVNTRVGILINKQFGKSNNTAAFIKGGYQTNGQYDKLTPNIYLITGITKSF
jgi:hypothetical protein